MNMKKRAPRHIEFSFGVKTFSFDTQMEAKLPAAQRTLFAWDKRKGNQAIKGGISV